MECKFEHRWEWEEWDNGKGGLDRGWVCSDCSKVAESTDPQIEPCTACGAPVDASQVVCDECSSTQGERKISLVEKLHKSRIFGTRPDGTYGIIGYESEVADLVRRIELRAELRGLTASRWLTNSTATGWAETITWAVHKGPRPARTNLLSEDAHTVVLRNTEGTTKRCEAFRKLSELLNSF